MTIFQGFEIYRAFLPPVSQLELRHYKNGFVSVKRMLVLKLPPFFPCRVGEGERAAISKQTCFSQKRVHSCIVLALVSVKTEGFNRNVAIKSAAIKR